MKVYQASSKIKKKIVIEMPSIRKRSRGLAGLEQLKLSIVGICVLATLLQCIGATGMFIVQEQIFPFLSSSLLAQIKLDEEM